MSTQGRVSLATPRVVRATGVTDSSGNAAFTFTPAFAAPPVVTVGVQAAAGFRSANITARTAAGCTVNVQASAGITLLGLGVLAVGAAAPNVTVHVIAVEA